MSRLLSLRHPPTAVYAHSDEVALGAVRTIRRAGLEIPRDISVVGIDDHPLAALTDLTTVRQPAFEQGVRAAEMLLGLLAGDRGRRPVRHLAHRARRPRQHRPAAPLTATSKRTEPARPTSISTMPPTTCVGTHSRSGDGGPRPAIAGGALRPPAVRPRQPPPTALSAVARLGSTVGGRATLEPVGQDRRGREGIMRRVVTVSEIEAMTAAERAQSFEDSIIYDLGQVPAEFQPALEAQRQRVLDRDARLRGNAS